MNKFKGLIKLREGCGKCIGGTIWDKFCQFEGRKEK